VDRVGVGRLLQFAVTEIGANARPLDERPGFFVSVGLDCGPTLAFSAAGSAAAEVVDRRLNCD
jgi:hypothetical protein